MAKLAEQVPARPAFPFKRPKTYFEGEVAEDSFRLTRAAYWGHDVFTLTSGKVSASNGETLISVLQHPGVFGWCWLASAGLFAVLVLLGLLNSFATAQLPEFGLVMAGVVLSLMLAGCLNDFWRSAGEAKAALINLVEGKEV